jgi:hypothetical protein
MPSGRWRCSLNHDQSRNLGSSVVGLRVTIDKDSPLAFRKLWIGKVEACACDGTIESRLLVSIQTPVFVDANSGVGNTAPASLKRRDP